MKDLFVIQIILTTFAARKEYLERGTFRERHTTLFSIAPVPPALSSGARTIGSFSF